MTCFWDGILRGLKQFPEFGMQSITRSEFIKHCEKHCDILIDKYKYVLIEGLEKNTRDVPENSVKYNLNIDGVSEHDIRTHYIPHIKELEDISKIDGYICSPCDGFLLFLCCYFEMNIHYKTKNWNNTDIQVCYLYNHPEKGYKNNKALFFSSTKDHFTYVSYIR